MGFSGKQNMALAQGGQICHPRASQVVQWVTNPSANAGDTRDVDSIPPVRFEVEIIVVIIPLCDLESKGN